MIPAGNRFQIIEYKELRRISQLPADVRIIRAMRDDYERLPGVGCAEGYARPILLLIQHRYCFVTPEGAPYVIEQHDDFLERYKRCDEIERQPLPTWQEGLPSCAWYRNKDGRLGLYFWASSHGIWLESVLTLT